MGAGGLVVEAAAAVASFLCCFVAFECLLSGRMSIIIKTTIATKNINNNKLMSDR